MLMYKKSSSSGAYDNNATSTVTTFYEPQDESQLSHGGHTSAKIFARIFLYIFEHKKKSKTYRGIRVYGCPTFPENRNGEISKRSGENPCTYQKKFPKTVTIYIFVLFKSPIV